MQLLSTFVFTAAVLTVPAIASAKDCGNPPAKLSVPNGTSASEQDMKATQEKFKPYAQAMGVYLKCLSDQIKAGKDEYDATVSDWAKQQAAFKAAPAK
jgi:hypothetical protein